MIYVTHYQRVQRSTPEMRSKIALGRTTQVRKNLTMLFWVYLYQGLKRYRYSACVRNLTALIFQLLYHNYNMKRVFYQFC